MFSPSPWELFRPGTPWWSNGSSMPSRQPPVRWLGGTAMGLLPGIAMGYLDYPRNQPLKYQNSFDVRVNPVNYSGSTYIRQIARWLAVEKPKTPRSSQITHAGEQSLHQILQWGFNPGGFNRTNPKRGTPVVWPACFSGLLVKANLTHRLLLGHLGHFCCGDRLNPMIHHDTIFPTGDAVH